MGINAKYEGKNDLRVGGLKISGNAEHVHGNRVLHHGTLLFNTSLETLRKCIRKDTSHYSSRGVMSNSASVTNLDILLKCFADISDFKSEMLNYFIQNTDGAVPYELAQAEITEADRMALSKYQTWEWNWAYGPEYTFSNIFKMNEKQYSCKLHIKDGIIRECNIDGSDSINIAAGKLIGYRHMVKDLSEAFRNENIFLTEQEVYNFF
jgi:lipoate-protein ligase A